MHLPPKKKTCSFAYHINFRFHLPGSKVQRKEILSPQLFANKMSVIYNAKVVPAQVEREEPEAKMLVTFGLLSGKVVCEVEVSEQAHAMELKEKVLSQLGYTQCSPFEKFQPAFDWKHKDGTDLHDQELVSQLEEFYVEEKRQEMVAAVLSQLNQLQYGGLSGIFTLDKVPIWMKENKDIVMAAVKTQYYELEDAPDNLRDDKEVVMTAMLSDARYFGHASKRLRNDKEVVLSALEKDGRLLGHASKKLRNDRDVVLAAVRKFGWTLAYASENLQNDNEMIQAAAAAHQSESAPDCPLAQLLVP